MELDMQPTLFAFRFSHTTSQEMFKANGLSVGDYEKSWLQFHTRQWFQREPLQSEAYHMPFVCPGWIGRPIEKHSRIEFNVDEMFAERSVEHNGQFTERNLWWLHQEAGTIFPIHWPRCFRSERLVRYQCKRCGRWTGGLRQLFKRVDDETVDNQTGTRRQYQARNIRVQ